MRLETYMETHFRPDREYIDGRIEKRNLGKFSHAQMQGAVMRWFFRRENEWDIRVLPELRIQVSPTRVRIPDVTVMRRSQEIEEVPTHPPLLVVEVLSPRDTLAGMQERVEDYYRFGIEHIWIIDPARRTGFIASPASIESVNAFFVPLSGIYLSLAELFGEIDAAL